MHLASRRSGIAIITVFAVGIGVLLGLAGWPQANRTLEFPGLILAAILTSALPVNSLISRDWAIVPLPFIFVFTSLLLLGPNATMFVATAGMIVQGLAGGREAAYFPKLLPKLPLRLLLNALTVLLAVLGAGFIHRSLGGTTARFNWPGQGLPIAAAVLAYCAITSVTSELLVPLLEKRRINRSWPESLLRGCPGYVIASTLSVGAVEVIDHRLWQVMVVAAGPLYLAYRAYCGGVDLIHEAHRRREVIDALDQGMSVVDDNGLVTLWTEALESILGCPRARALGHSVVEAVPALAKTELVRAIPEVLRSRTQRTLSNLGVSSPAGPRILEVRMFPVSGGVTLLWRDITDRAREEHALKRHEERLALAAEGSNDGLWEWDLRTQEIYYSARWRAMVGLDSPAGIGRPSEWMDRVHEDDLAALREALDAHLSGKTPQFQHEHRIRHEDGTYRRYLCRGVAVRGAGRRMARIAGSLTDTTDRAVAQEQLRRAGFLDPLTGLSNRAVFVEGLGRRLEEYKEGRAASRFAVLYLDLDRFKVVNDSLGHLVGDELLTEVSRRLESCLRPGDAIARLGGDEFAILLNGLGDEQQANAIAFRIQGTLSEPFAIGGREVFTSASIGIALGRPQYGNPEEIMRDADTAMYHAKSRGKARHELFDADMHARAMDRLGLENDLRHAIEHNDFEVHYQPIVSLASGMCVGFESLVRWTRNGEAISPATFVPMAEELGLIEQLGTWVLQEACSTFAGWQRRFPSGGLDFITVNVSSRQLAQQNFFYLVEKSVEKSGLKPCDLRLEITETALMDSPHLAAELLRELRDFGVKIYLDDFGTGYSSLSHLVRLPVDALKIDRSFVRSLLLPERPAIVESILALARTLNTSVVAEGIESDVQALELERLGCTHAQGFLFSRPLSSRAAEEMLAAGKPLGPKKVNDREADDLSAPFDWSEQIVAPVSASSRSQGSQTRSAG